MNLMKKFQRRQFNILMHSLPKNIVDSLADPTLASVFRPPSESFPDTEIVGLLSGPIIMSSYATVLYNLRHGWKWGIGLGCFTVIASFAGVATNRHFFSQCVASATFGTIYAIAAYKVLKAKNTVQRDSNP